MLSIKDLSSILPENLRMKFDNDKDISTKVVPTLNVFTEWFDNSRIPFFKDYTDHSTKHSLDVFKTGCGFLTEGASCELSARDVAVFATSCFAHDAGMHLSEEHFLALIKINDAPLSEFDNLTWKQLWDDFAEEARRFSKRRLMQIFGSDRFVEMPPDDPLNFTDRHRLLIGEFLRLNHPRLAHDLVLGLDTQLGLEPLLPLFDKEERDIVGLIARSHGSAIRTFFPYVDRQYHLLDFRGLHIIFLMCLLGLADYAQIDSYRAPKARLKMIVVSSPISRREWRVHQCVRNITPLHSDPECFYVDAAPEVIEDYLRLEAWLLGIQQALDTSWAILGEVYGRFTQENLHRLTMTVRRVRSSIFEKNRNISFVPERVHFAVAEAEMLSLLLEPLYGDHPGYGVRELLQNAVDAVREFRCLRETNLNVVENITIELNANGNAGILIVEDRGVGMTLNTIKSYFLNAGASFRSSSEWQKKFVDDSGNTDVVRTGRFGVGALAAFIVGPRISVVTRHYSEVGAWEFGASLLDEQIEIRKTSAPIGTKITIDVAPSKLNDLRQFLADASRFFEFDDLAPTLAIIEDGIIVHKAILEKKSLSLYSGSSANYESIVICPGRRSIYENNPDFVNGIAITPLDKDAYANRIIDLKSLVQEPFLCAARSYYRRSNDVSCRVVDRNSRVLTNLARNQFARIDEELSEYVADLAFDELLKVIPSSSAINYLIEAPAEFYDHSRTDFVLCSNGVTLLDTYCLNASKLKRLVGLSDKSILTIDFMKRHSETGFIFDCGFDSSAALSSIVYYVRQARQEAGRHNFVARWSRDQVERVLNISALPQWIRRILEPYNESLAEIRFGEPDLPMIKVLDDVIKSNIDHSATCIAPKAEWFSEISRRHLAEPPVQTRISKRWSDAYAASNAIAPFKV